jgi:hypothetical protein
MVDALFEKKPRYLIIAELDTLSTTTKDPTVSLGLMELGIISEKSTGGQEKYSLRGHLYLELPLKGRYYYC